MQRILVVKTSSMGDVIHALPALTDAGRMLNPIQFDWVVEENFKEIPMWHPLVERIIPVALRRWRKAPFAAATRQEWKQFRQALRLQHYDYVIDAQGLVKSAIVTRLADGERCGYDWQSAREPLASCLYQRRIRVSKQQHAVTRVRELFARVLGYELPTDLPDYGIANPIALDPSQKPIILFIHGTTWASKLWPQAYWIALAQLANQQGYQVQLPWGNSVEQQRATEIASQCEDAVILPRLNLSELRDKLLSVKAAVAVDTGLGHMAAALAVPTLSLYGPTDPQKVGTLGKAQQQLAMSFGCVPCRQTTCHYQSDATISPACYQDKPPLIVWEKLREML